MAQELELSDYATVHELRENTGAETTSSNSEQSERRLLRIGIFILGVLCILQAVLNISLQLTFYSKEDIDPFPFNISAIEDLCKTEQFQQNSTRLSSCCSNLLRKLLSQYHALETERKLLQDRVIQLNRGRSIEDADEQSSGSGFWEEFSIQTEA